MERERLARPFQVLESCKKELRWQLAALPVRIVGRDAQRQELFAFRLIDHYTRFLDSCKLLMSELPHDVLAAAWEMADQEHRGKLNRQQVLLLLGLLSTAQSGQPLEPALVTVHTSPPLLQGMAPP